MPGTDTGRPSWHLRGLVHSHDELTHPDTTEDRHPSPLAFARLALWLTSNARNRQIAETRSDEAGRFEFDLNALKAMDPYSRRHSRLLVRGRADGHADASSFVPGFVECAIDRTGHFPASDSGIDHDTLPPRESDTYRPEMLLRLRPGCDIRGKVVDEFGNAVHDAALVAYRFGMRLEAICEFPPDGGVTIPSYDLGKGPLRIRGEVEDGAVTRWVHLPRVPTEPVDLGDLPLLFEHGLRLRILDADGRPAPHACFDLRYAEGRSDSDPEFEWTRSFVTDSQGRFTAGRLRPGRYEVSLGKYSPDREERATFELETSQEIQELRMPCSRVLVRLELGDGQPLELDDLDGLDVCLFDGAAASEAELVATSGPALATLLDRARARWQTSALWNRPDLAEIFAKPGDFVMLRLSLPGLQPLIRGLRVPASPRLTWCTLRLQPLERAATLQLRPAAGLPSLLLSVSLRDARHGLVTYHAKGWARSAKPFVLGQLAPGNYRCVVEYCVSQHAPKDAAVPPGAGWQLDVQLRAGSSASYDLPLRRRSGR